MVATSGRYPLLLWNDELGRNGFAHTFQRWCEDNGRIPHPLTHRFDHFCTVGERGKTVLMQKMTKQVAGMGAVGKVKAMRELARSDSGMVPGVRGMPSLGGRGSTKTASRRTQFKQKKKRR